MADTIVETTVVEPPAQRRQSRLSFIGGFLKWVFTGFGLFSTAKGDTEVVYTVDRGFFLWALVLIGFAGSGIVAKWPETANALGWIWAITISYTLVLLLTELNTWKFIAWSAVILLLYLIVRYPLGWLGIVPGMGKYLNNLHPTLSPDLAQVVSWGALILFVSSLYNSFANGRKTFSPNSIEEWHFLTGSEVFDKGMLRFRTRYPDLLETILGFGAGEIVAFDRAGRIQKRYENVFGLFFKWKRLDKILHTRFAEVDNIDGDVVNVHDDQDDHPLR